MKKDKLQAPASVEKLRWYSHEEVFKAYWKDPEFRKGYNEEMLQLQLAMQIREARTSKKLA
jgi:hypothetical protein